MSEEPENKHSYFYAARGNSKSLLSIVQFCREIGMTDEEIIELWNEAIERTGGTTDGVLE